LLEKVIVRQFLPPEANNGDDSKPHNEIPLVDLPFDPLPLSEGSDRKSCWSAIKSFSLSLRQTTEVTHLTDQVNPFPL
jgi:hypothetical protein